MIRIEKSGLYSGLEGNVVISANDVTIENSAMESVKLDTNKNLAGIEILKSSMREIIAYIIHGNDLESVHLKDLTVSNGEGIRFTAEPDKGSMKDISLDSISSFNNKAGIKIRNVGGGEQRHYGIKGKDLNLFNNEHGGLIVNYFDGLAFDDVQCFKNGTTSTLGGAWVDNSINGYLNRVTGSYNTTPGIDGNGILIDGGCADIDVTNAICVGNKGNTPNNSGAGIMVLSVNNVLVQGAILRDNKHDLFIGGKNHERSYYVDNVYESLHYGVNLSPSAEIVGL